MQVGVEMKTLENIIFIFIFCVVGLILCYFISYIFVYFIGKLFEMDNLLSNVIIFILYIFVSVCLFILLNCV